MIFGDKSAFAIEAEALDRTGKWFFGRLRIWVTNKSLGEFEDTSDLASSARWARQFLAASPRRARPELDAADAATVYRALFGRFFEPGGSSPSERFERDPWLLDDVGESSLRDRVSILAVGRGDRRDRIVVREHGTGETWEAVVPEGACDDALLAYCAWVERQLGVAPA